MGGKSPIFYAPKPLVVDVLVNNNADVTKIDNQSETPLFEAVRKLNKGVVKALVKSKVSIEHSNTNNETVFTILTTMKSQEKDQDRIQIINEILETLNTQGVPDNHNTQSPLSNRDTINIDNIENPHNNIPITHCSSNNPEKIESNVTKIENPQDLTHSVDSVIMNSEGVDAKTENLENPQDSIEIQHSSLNNPDTAENTTSRSSTPLQNELISLKKIDACTTKNSPTNNAPSGENNAAEESTTKPNKRRKQNQINESQPAHQNISTTHHLSCVENNAVEESATKPNKKRKQNQHNEEQHAVHQNIAPTPNASRGENNTVEESTSKNIHEHKEIPLQELETKMKHSKLLEKKEMEPDNHQNEEQESLKFTGTHQELRHEKNMEHQQKEKEGEMEEVNGKEDNGSNGVVQRNKRIKSNNEECGVAHKKQTSSKSDTPSTWRSAKNTKIPRKNRTPDIKNVHKKSKLPQAMPDTSETSGENKSRKSNLFDWLKERIGLKASTPSSTGYTETTPNSTPLSSTKTKKSPRRPATGKINKMVKKRDGVRKKSNKNRKNDDKKNEETDREENSSNGGTMEDDHMEGNSDNIDGSGTKKINKKMKHKKVDDINDGENKGNVSKKGKPKKRISNMLNDLRIEKNQQDAIKTIIRLRKDKRCCNVDGCYKMVGRRRTEKDDKYGKAGLRCAKHNGKVRRCNILGCNNNYRRIISIKDKLGKPGPRCERHNGGIKCSTINCNKLSHYKYAVNDQPHCKFHGSIGSVGNKKIFSKRNLKMTIGKNKMNEK